MVRKANPSPLKRAEITRGSFDWIEGKQPYFPKMFCDAQWHAHGVGAPAIPIITRYAPPGRGRARAAQWPRMLRADVFARTASAGERRGDVPRQQYPASSTPAAVPLKAVAEVAPYPACAWLFELVCPLGQSLCLTGLCFGRPEGGVGGNAPEWKREV